MNLHFIMGLLVTPCLFLSTVNFLHISACQFQLAVFFTERSCRRCHNSCITIRTSVIIQLHFKIYLNGSWNLSIHFHFSDGLIIIHLILPAIICPRIHSWMCEFVTVIKGLHSCWLNERFGEVEIIPEYFSESSVITLSSWQEESDRGTFNNKRWW